MHSMEQYYQCKFKPLYHLVELILLKDGLQKLGYKRVQEIEDPEIATKPTRAIYIVFILLIISLKKSLDQSLI